MNIKHKPLGHKAYGSIGHLPQSRMGTGDHAVPMGQADICLSRPRDKNDTIIVQEKLDGSCVAVCKLNGLIQALGRAGYLAQSSQYEQHQLFACWVQCNYERFDGALVEGERIVGEWLAQAHGTRYDLPNEPFVAFDIMQGTARLPYESFSRRVCGKFVIPRLLSYGSRSMTIADALELLEDRSHHGAIDDIEGVVYRVERCGEVDFLAKYVRQDKVDGRYLPEISGHPAVWNWRP